MAESRPVTGPFNFSQEQAPGPFNFSQEQAPGPFNFSEESPSIMERVGGFLAAEGLGSKNVIPEAQQAALGQPAEAQKQLNEAIAKQLASLEQMKATDPAAYRAKSIEAGGDPLDTARALVNTRYVSDTVFPMIAKAVNTAMAASVLPSSALAASISEMQKDPAHIPHSTLEAFGRGIRKTLTDLGHGEYESWAPVMEKTYGEGAKRRAFGWLLDAALGSYLSTPGVLHALGTGMEALGAERGTSALARYGEKAMERFRGSVPEMTPEAAQSVKDLENLQTEFKARLAGTSPAPIPLTEPYVEPPGVPVDASGEKVGREIASAFPPADVRLGRELSRAFPRTPEMRIEEQMGKLGKALPGPQEPPLPSVMEEAKPAPPAGDGVTLPEDPQGALGELASRTRSYISGLSEKAVTDATNTRDRWIVPAYAKEQLDRVAGETMASDIEALKHITDMHQSAGLEILLRDRGFKGAPDSLSRYLTYKIEGLPEGWTGDQWWRAMRKAFPKLSDTQLLELEAASQSPKAKRLIVQHRTLMDALNERDAAAGIEYDPRERYVPHSWKNDENTVRNIAARIASRVGLAPGQGFTKARSIPTLLEGVEAGLKPVDNLFELDFRRSINSIHGAAMNLTLKGLSGGEGALIKPPAEAPVNWTNVQDGPLAGKAVHPALWSRIETIAGMGADANPLGAWWDFANGRLKGLNFFFDTPHIWNMGQNAIVGGGNPLKAVRWYKQIAERGPEYIQAARDGAFGTGKLGMDGSRLLMADLIGDVSQDKMAPRRWWDWMANKAHRGMWEYGDKGLKMELWDEGKAAGLTGREAGKFAAHFIGDYDKLPPGLKGAGRLIFTLRWQYINLTLNAEEFVRAPQKLAAAMNIRDAVWMAMTGVPPPTSGTGSIVTPIQAGPRQKVRVSFPSPLFAPLRLAAGPSKYFYNVANPFIKAVIDYFANQKKGDLPGQELQRELTEALQPEQGYTEFDKEIFWKLQDMEAIQGAYKQGGPMLAVGFAMLRAAGLSVSVYDPVNVVVGKARQFLALGRTVKAQREKALRERGKPTSEENARAIAATQKAMEEERQNLIWAQRVKEGLGPSVPPPVTVP